MKKSKSWLAAACAGLAVVLFTLSGNIFAYSQESEPNTDTDLGEVKAINAEFNFDAVTKGTYVKLSDEAEAYQDIIRELSNDIPDFDMSDYRVFVNEYADGKGTVKLRYYIGDIQTSAVLTIVVEDGKAEYMSSEYSAAHYGKVNEDIIIEKADRFIKEKNSDMTERARLNSKKARFYYDFEDGNLYYIEELEQEIADAIAIEEVKTLVK